MRAQVAAARAALAALEAAGHGERFGANAAPSEVRAFRENTHRFEAEEAAARVARSRLAELKAVGASAAEIAAVRSRAEAHALEAANYRDILLRQKSIKDFYYPPKAGYTAKAAAIRELEAELMLLGGSSETDS